MFGVRLSKMGSASKLGLIAKAIGILRKYGTDAHVYLPGIGTVSGLTAGNYLDSAGTTAASVDNPVGLSLDALQDSAQPNQLTSASDFSNAAWGKAGCTPTGSLLTCTLNGKIYQVLTGVSQGYVFYTDLVAGSATVAQLTLNNGASYVGNVEFNLATGQVGTQTAGTGTIALNADGSYRCTIRAPLAASASCEAGIGVIGVGTITATNPKLIKDFSATQATTANKPILRRGTLNLLTWSDVFDNAAWLKSTATVTADTSTGPTGLTNADTLTATSGGGKIYRTFTGSATTYTLSVYIKAGTLTTANLSLNNGSSYVGNVNFNLSTVTATPVTGTGSITLDSNGFYRCSVSAVLAASSACEIGIGATTGSTGTLIISGAQLEVGGVVSDYSPTTTAAASNPSAGKYSWQFDGSNDSLSLSAPLFQMSDDHWVITGINFATAPAATQVFISPSQANGSDHAALLGITTSGKIFAEWNAVTGGLVYLTSAANKAGAPCVVSAFKTGNTKILRVNGVQEGVNSTPQTVTTASTVGYIGSYDGASLYFGGSSYASIGGKGTITPSDLLTLERFVGQLSGVTGI